VRIVRAPQAHITVDTRTHLKVGAQLLGQRAIGLTHLPPRVFRSLGKLFLCDDERVRIAERAQAPLGIPGKGPGRIELLSMPPGRRSSLQLPADAPRHAAHRGHGARVGQLEEPRRHVLAQCMQIAAQRRSLRD